MAAPKPIRLMDEADYLAIAKLATPLGRYADECLEIRKDGSALFTLKGSLQTGSTAERRACIRVSINPQYGVVSSKRRAHIVVMLWKDGRMQHTDYWMYWDGNTWVPGSVQAPPGKPDLDTDLPECTPARFDALLG